MKTQIQVPNPTPPITTILYTIDLNRGQAATRAADDIDPSLMALARDLAAYGGRFFFSEDLGLCHAIPSTIGFGRR